ncbi:glycosyltransferase [Elizabethkingia bruuniana]|uniref:glycosyltransferase n=1 Tax=Elizabethkingia bruuniana TaxID=1756149 RepID=UPI00241BF417|nr:glycosyltransferase [Elizabethkingia bruuniana]
MKKIVFIITDYGSFNNFIGDAAVELARAKNEVHLISSSTKVIEIEDKFDYKNEGIYIHTVELPRGFNLFKHYNASKKIKSIVDGIQPDIVSIHFTTGVFTSTFNGRLKFKTIGTFHGLGYPVVEGKLKKLIYKFVEKRSLNRIDEAWVLNRFDLELIKQDFPTVPVFQIPSKGMGCDISKFDPQIFDFSFKKELKESLKINEDDFIIGFTGRFVSFKGFDKVIRAFRILIEEKKINNLKLLLIGGLDKAHNTGLTEEESYWVESCDNIINIGFTSEVNKYLSITDIFVFPSEKEGMPVCIIEALAMGVPVITANARGCNDLIINNLNGVLLQRNSPEEIALQIQNLKNNTDRRNEMKNIILGERKSMSRGLFVKQQVDYFNTTLC